MGIGLSIFLGVVGSFVASILFLAFASIFRPKLSISKNIAVWEEEDGTTYYSVKVVNCGYYSAINITAEFSIIGLRKVQGGLGKRIYDIDLKKNNLLVLRPYDKKDPRDCTYEFLTRKNLPKIWEDKPDAKLFFRVFAQHSFTSFSKLFEQKYDNQKVFIKGRFGFGDSMDIK